MVKLDKVLVVGVSSRALFDMSCENKIFEEEGLDEYCRHMREHESEPLAPGSAFGLIKALLRLNDNASRRRVEVIIMSRNSADTSLRIFNSLKHYGLDITRAVLTSGAPLSPYLNAFSTDLFLSADEEDVRNAISSKVAAGIVCTDHGGYDAEEVIDTLKIAFDGDAVLFSGESDRIWQERGEGEFIENEIRHADTPLPEGPFAPLLKTLSFLQNEFEGAQRPIRTALVTARNAPAHERVIRTLRAWDVKIDEAFFLGGMDKKEFLHAFGAHIFFDDTPANTDSAKELVATARVPLPKSE
ncbi:MAG: 5'-nucleotidase [Clostridia bacterium]|nr:5'-nucleotidase [Clostridia bacterium]